MEVVGENVPKGFTHPGKKGPREAYGAGNCPTTSPGILPSAPGDSNEVARYWNDPTYVAFKGENPSRKVAVHSTETGAA